MKKGIYLFSTATLCLLFFCCSSMKKNQEKNMLITGTVLVKKNYCGGARPSQEILDESKKYKPLKSKEFYIKKGVKNDMNTPLFKTIKTNENGKFSITLPVGSYILLSKEQLNREIFEKQDKNIKIINQEKLDTWWHNGLHSINEENKTIELKLHKKCFLPLGVPYLRYTGPMPA